MGRPGFLVVVLIVLPLVVPGLVLGGPGEAPPPTLTPTPVRTATPRPPVATPRATPVPTAMPVEPARSPEPSPTRAPTSTAAPPAPTASATATAPRPVATPTLNRAGLPGAVVEPEAANGRVRTIAIDPGHGGPEPGGYTDELTEKELTLAIGLKLARLLTAAGYRSVMTRNADRAVSPGYIRWGMRDQVLRDLQARVDIANAHRADLFISIHVNNLGRDDESGVEVWYNSRRPFADRNIALAGLVQSAIVGQLRALAYDVVDRGIKDDARFLETKGPGDTLFLLSPGDGGAPRAVTEMPGVLGETLVMSNPDDAAMLRREGTLDAIARGYRDAVLAYFERFG